MEYFLRGFYEFQFSSWFQCVMTKASSVKRLSDECHWTLLIVTQHWCHQKTSHCLSKCWHWFILPYGITRSYWFLRERLSMAVLLRIYVITSCEIKFFAVSYQHFWQPPTFHFRHSQYQSGGSGSSFCDSTQSVLRTIWILHGYDWWVTFVV